MRTGCDKSATNVLLKASLPRADLLPPSGGDKIQTCSLTIEIGHIYISLELH